MDVKSKLNAEDIFVLASQAHQVYYAPNISNTKSSWYTVLTTKSRQVDETTSPKEEKGPDDDALQNAVSNVSSSHFESVIICDPSNFFIDLGMFENDFAKNYNVEDDGENDDEDESEEDHENEDEEDEQNDDVE